MIYIVVNELNMAIDPSKTLLILLLKWSAKLWITEMENIKATSIPRNIEME